MTRRSEVGIDITASDHASREIRAVGGALSGMGGNADEAGRKVGLAGRVVQGVSQGVFLGVGLLATQAFARGMQMIPNAVIGMNASLEKSTLQFETLFKDADRAREHVRMLFEFAKSTPFETEPIINASRTMQTFGGDALNTQKNLSMIGDAAAGASTDISGVAFWVSRAYAAIQGGQPFGEARMRLQELALLSPQAAKEMEGLQKAGAASAEVWGVMERELGKFTGAMKKQEATWTGLTSTLSDTLNLTIADAFKPFFEYAKDGLKAMIALFNSPEFQNGLRDFAAAAVKAIASLIEVLGVVLPIAGQVVGALFKVIETGVAVVKGVIAFVDRFKIGFLVIVGLIGAYVIPGFVAWAISAAAAWLATIGPIVIAAALVIGFVAVVAMIIQAFVDWLASLLPVQIAIAAFKLVVEAVGDALGWLGDRLHDVGEFFGVVEADAWKTGDAVGESFKDMRGMVGRELDVMAADVEASGKIMAATVRDDWKKDIGGATKEVADAATGAIAAGNEEIKTIMRRTPGDIADALISGQDTVTSAAEALAKALEEPISFARRVAGLQGILASKELAAGLASNDPLVRAAAVKLKESVDAQLLELQKGAHVYGERTTKAYAAGLESAWGYVQGAAAKVVGAATGAFKASSPPGPQSPLHKIDVWGAKTAEAWAKGLEGGVQAVVGPLRLSLGDVGSVLQSPPLAGPSVTTRSSTASAVINQTFNFGPGSVRSEDDIRRLGVEMQSRAELQGFASTMREVGRVVA